MFLFLTKKKRKKERRLLFFVLLVAKIEAKHFCSLYNDFKKLKTNLNGLLKTFFLLF